MKTGLGIAGALALGLSACGSGDEVATTAVDTPVAASVAADVSEYEMSEDEMEEHEPVTFVVTIENLTDTTDLASPLAPGAAVVTDDAGAIISEGAAASPGLEALAEDGPPGDFVIEIDGVVFAVPADSTEAGPALPGYKLTFATMYVQSNDWFFAPGADGIELFDADGEPLVGDVTSSVYLWDAGTEADQTSGEGADQAPRQSGPNTGDDDADNMIRILGAADGIRVMVSAS